mmetsp:Transcript_3746/g.3475  ORF Transcript_3746/g.3475 Transcript_3746/m.3475 type:complete len:83 (+) Transcript_3746:1121-1369(+)
MIFLWYLANDMWFFMFLPLIVLAYLNQKFLGYFLSIFMIIANIVTVFTISYLGDHPMVILKDENPSVIYHHPYSRFGPYFVG